jgi:hypothetical protein
MVFVNIGKDGCQFSKVLSGGNLDGLDGRGEESIQGFGGKVRRKEPFERPRRRWKDGIRMDLMEVGLKGV